MSAWVSTRASDHGSLRPDHYQWICPQAEAIVLAGVQRAVAQEARMAGSLLIQKHDEAAVQQFCMDLGVKKKARTQGVDA
jgi:hypothetical protein